MQIKHEANAIKTARYYTGEAKSFPLGSLVWWNQPSMDKKDGDRIPNRKLRLQWSGPFIFRGAVNDTMGIIEQQRDRQPTGKRRNVHLSQLRLYLRLEQYENEIIARRGTSISCPVKTSGGNITAKTTSGNGESNGIEQSVSIEPEPPTRIP